MADEASLRRSSRRRNVAPPLPYATSNLFHKPVSSSEIRMYGVTLKCLTKKPPNVFLIKDFLSDSEIEHLGTLISAQGTFKSSFTEDHPGSHVFSEHRTSKFVWLGKQQDSVVSRIEQRGADIVGVPASNVEPLQVVSYTKGQQFKLHHDAGSLEEDGSVEVVEPRRIATLFVYLNSMPKGHGHTEFPSLKLSVQPLRGAAVLFPNVTPDGQAEVLTIHQALPVSSPDLRKFGMNIWVTAQSVQALAMVDKSKKKSKKRKSESDDSQYSSDLMHFFAPNDSERRCRVCRKQKPVKEMLVCSGCAYGWHASCLKKESMAGPNAWFCSRCSSTFCLLCSKRFKSSELTIACDMCDASYHRQCVKGKGLPCQCSE